MFEKLAKTDFSRIEFRLEFHEPFVLKREMVLRLRREFLRVARNAVRSGVASAESLMALLDPSLSDDPYARRLFQKPAPPFIIRPPIFPEQCLDAGDVLTLEVCFIGEVSRHIVSFAMLLNALGDVGFCRGEGKFELVGLASNDQNGNLFESLLNSEKIDQLVVPQLSLGWLVEETVVYDRNMILTFETPARLLSNNTPLFHISFAEIFPFMLRRVTSMLHAWGNIELTDDASYLIKRAERIEVVINNLTWQDWRTLDDGIDHQDLGGIAGQLELGQVESDEILVIIALAELFNIGKSAAYGCGHFNLTFLA